MRSISSARKLAQKSRKSTVLEQPPAGLALRAVEDRVLLEIDLLDRRPADVTGLVQLLVHAVDLRVLGAPLAQLEPSLELRVDRVRECSDLSRGQSLGRGERGQLRRVQDLVRPR